MALTLGNGITINITPVPGGGGGAEWELISTNTQLISGHAYLLDFGIVPAPFDMTLPILPEAGDTITLFHIRGDVEAMVSFPRILRNGERLNGVLEHMNFDVNYIAITLVYSVSAIGWSVA